MAMATSTDSQSAGYGARASFHPGQTLTDPRPIVHQEQQPDWIQGFDPSPFERTRADGGVQKKRGPKPTNKPAATKRQELNRNAQRTHRARKDQYVQKLEWRIGRARESYLAQAREIGQLKVENDDMARLLQGAGIPYRSHASRKASMTSGYNGNSGGGGTSGAPAEGRPFQLFMSSRVPTAPMRRFPLRAGEKMGYQDPSSVNRSSVVRQSSLPTASPMNATSVPSRGTTHLNEYVSQDSVGMATMADYKAPSTGDFLRFKERATMLKEPVGIFKNNQIGVLFVQRLEAVYTEHKKLMENLATKTQPGLLTGHIHMLTSPPKGYYQKHPYNDHYHRVPDLPPEKIMEYVQQTDFGQPMLYPGIRPQQALEIIMTHERCAEITLEDLRGLTKALYQYVNCDGFGATLSVWHMNREVDNIFARKDQKQQMEVLALDERFGGFDSNTELTAYR